MINKHKYPKVKKLLKWIPCHNIGYIKFNFASYCEDLFKLGGTDALLYMKKKMEAIKRKQ